MTTDPVCQKFKAPGRVSKGLFSKLAARFFALGGAKDDKDFQHTAADVFSHHGKHRGFQLGASGAPRGSGLRKWEARMLHQKRLGKYGSYHGA